jgi:hypothetical protein
MGSRAYDFLTESFLFDEALLRDSFSSVSDSELASELRRYRDFVLDNRVALVSEVNQSQSNLNIFSGRDRVSLRFLKQCALYIHQYIIDDPLIPLSVEPTKESEAFNQIAGLKPSPFDKQDLAARLRFLKDLTPMVAADFVKLLPISTLFEPPKLLPIFHSENQFSDALPRALMEIFHGRAEVRSMRKSGSGYVIADELFPCRQIHVGFRGHPHLGGMMYSLLDIAAQSLDEESRTAWFNLTQPEAPPTLERFQPWVLQSINRTAINIQNQLLTELTMADDLNSVYSTRSELICELLEKVVPPVDSIPTHTANVFLNMELPFLADVDASELMRIRSADGEAFESFRVELDSKLRDLRLIDDPEEARVKAENAVHELTEVQVHDVNRKLASVKEKAALTAAMATTGFMAAVQTGGASLLATAAACVTGAQAVLDYRKDVKRHPAFFMWRVKKEAQRNKS